MKRRVYPLHVLVTGLLVVCLGVPGGLLVGSQYRARKEHAFADAGAQMRTQLMMTQARVERDLANRNFSSVASEVVMLKLLDDVNLSAVVDELGIVRYSSNFVIVDQPAATQLHQFDGDLFAQMQRNSRSMLVSDESRENLFGYYPLAFSRTENSMRPDRIGALFVHWSLERPYRYLQLQVLREAGYLLLLTLLASGGLFLLLRRKIVRPLRRLQQKADYAAGGQDVQNFSENGVAETVNLGQALDRMRQQQLTGLQDVRRSEERWLFALDAAGQGVHDWDLVRGQCYFSPQCRRVLGLDATAPLACDDWKKQVLAEDWNFVERRLERHFQGLSDFCNAEYRIMGADGNPHYILMRGRVVERKPDGSPGRFVATHADVTSRRRMEDALRNSEEKYRRLFEMAQEGIWVIDAAGLTTIVNNAMASMLGYKKEEMIGRHLFDFMDEDSRTAARENMKRRAQGIEEQHDFEFLASNGRRVFTTMQTAPIFDGNGVYAGAIAGVMDITERKRAEERIRQQALFDELTRLPNPAPAQ